MTLKKSDFDHCIVALSTMIIVMVLIFFIVMLLQQGWGWPDALLLGFVPLNFFTFLMVMNLYYEHRKSKKK